MFWMIDRSNVKLSHEDDPQERRLLDWYCDKIIAKINNTDEWKKHQYLKRNKEKINKILLHVIKSRVNFMKERCNFLTEFLKNRTINLEIDKLMNYETFFHKKNGISYTLSKYLNCNVCVYCGRIYTTTVYDENGGELIKPAFDHYFPKDKDKYPLLALSFYNLIPSCNYCNSSIKRTKEFDLEKHYFPYTENASSVNEDFAFSYTYKSVDKPEINIDVKDKNSKAKETLNFMYTKDVYQYHNNYELKALLRKRDKYPLTRIKEIMDQTKGILSEEDIYHFILGEDVGLDDEEELNRPLFKLKNDLAKEIFPEGFNILRNKNAKKVI